MAITGLNLTSEVTHVSKFDAAKGTPDETRFRLGSLDSRVLGVLQDKATSIRVNPSNPDEDVDTQINSKAFQFEVCQFGVRGWENFKDDNGNDIPFRTVKLNRGGKSYDVVDGATLARIPGVVLEELAERIMSGNMLTSEEGKH